MKHEAMSVRTEDPKRGSTFEDNQFSWMRQEISME
jgi:hypothetical protein